MSTVSPLHRARTGLWAWVGVALSLLAMTGTSMHVLLVEHELCDEHGALVEGSAHTDEDASGDDTTDAHDQDVHCPLGVAASAPLAAPPAVALEALITSAHVDVDVAAAEVMITRDVWRTAPKTSPPRV